MRRLRVPFFRIFYSSTYTFLLLFTLLLIAIIAVDQIYQTLDDGKFGNVFVIAGVYFVTALIACFIYASRLYTNRTTLAAIPRSYLPIEDGEISGKVRRAIVANRQRSAMIALNSRPRDRRAENAPRDQPNASTGSLTHLNAANISNKLHISKGKQPEINMQMLAQAPPPWGNVAHPGWSAPSSDDLPSLEFDTVVKELPNIIEAKAVSLAPPDPAFDFMALYQGEVVPPPDPQAVSALQRAPSATLRDYLGSLAALGVLLASESLIADFVTQYEHARFSSDATTEDEFRTLIDTFGAVLASVELGNGAGLARRISRAGSVAASETGSVRRMPTLRPELARAASIASMRSYRSTSSVIHHILT